MKIKLTELGRHEALLRISSILKAGDKHIQLERKLTSELIKNWRETYENALREIFRRIPEELSQQVIDIVTQGLADSLGQSFGSSQKVRDELRKYITSAYQGGKLEFAVKSKLELPDIRAIDVLTRHNCYWIGEHYGNHIGKKIAELTQDAITDGLARKELAEELRAELGGKSEGYKYWDVVSSAALVRSRSFGCVAGMAEAGITEYEILAMGDERMCPICGEMHGRTFSVSETQRVIDSVLDIKSPDKFKEAMPWQTTPPIGVSSAKLLAEGMSIPPFHGRCRCVLVMAEESFPVVNTLDEANRVAVRNGISREANFEGTDVRVANEFFSVIHDTKKLLPEFETFDFVGSEKQLFEYECRKEFEFLRAQYPFLDIEDLRIQARENVSAEFPIRLGQWAVSSFGSSGRGLGFAERYISPKNIKYSLEELSRDAKDGLTPVGCGTLEAIIDHEVGHHIDFILNACEDKKILGIFESLSKTDIVSGLSEYGSDDVREFIAESWSEYRNNPNPRKISLQVSKRLLELWRVKFRK